MFLLLSLAVLFFIQSRKSNTVYAKCLPSDGPEEGLTTFVVEVQYEWNKEADAGFPNQDTSNPPGFKPMSCVTHNSEFTLWEAKKPAEKNFKQFFQDAAKFAETGGGGDPYTSITNEYSLNGSNMDVDKPFVLDFAYKEVDLQFGTTVEPEDNFNVSINASNDFPLISCFAMVWPSSDWFVGVSNINVCEYAPAVLDKATLFAFDAGIYRTLDYITGNLAEPEMSPGPFIRQVRVVASDGFGSLTINQKDSKLKEEKNNSPNACFPADERVTLSSGHVVRMHQLSINDMVLSSTSSSSLLSSPSSFFSSTASRIIAFSHRDKTIISRFVHIFFEFRDGSVNDVRLSPGHFIYRHMAVSEHVTELVMASEIKAGDVLVDGRVSDVRDHPVVVSVNASWGRGLYNPHSMNGDLVVGGGVRVSCYTSAVPPAVATSAFTPIRLIFRLGFGPIADSITQFISTAGRVLKTIMTT